MAAAMNKPEAKPWINAIHAYTPGKAKSDDGRVLIKLSANEMRWVAAPMQQRLWSRPGRR